MGKVFRRYFTQSEERKLFATVKRDSTIEARRDYAWMQLLRHTGIRVGTLSLLNVLDAKEALEGGDLVLRAEITKRKQGGQVFLTVKAKAALRELLKIRSKQGWPDSPDAPLIYSRNRSRMSIRSYEARTRYWCKAAGLKVRGTPHWFRHTLAKRIMQNSTATDPLGVVSSVLGHASISSTTFYTRPDREEIERAMEEVGNG